MPSTLDLGPDFAASDFVRFREFWVEVEAVRAAIAEGGDVDASIARMRFRDLLRAQQSELVRSSAPAAALEAYREAQYVMAAVADDVLIQLPWTGASEWMLHPLELDLFGSRCAGLRVFERIDAIIGGNNPNASHLVPIYVTALALGFVGMYADDPRKIAEYRDRLRNYSGGMNLDSPLVPQCYQNTLELAPIGLLSSAREWWWAAAAVVGVWLITSSLLWWQLSGAGQ